MNPFTRIIRKIIRATFLAVAAITVVPVALAGCYVLHFLRDWAVCIYAATTGRPFKLTK